MSSPLRRAVDTAELALPDADVTIVDALREVDYGTYEGRTTAEITAEQPGWELFTNGAPNGEGLAQVVARCDSVIAKIERTAADRVVVVVTHGHLGRVLVARLLGLPGQVAATLYHDTGSLGVVERRRGSYVLTGWNIRPS
jgi:probable phosphoglycerate mutase